QPAADGEYQQPMGDGFAERRGLGELVIDVNGVKIPAQPGVVDHIRFGDGPAGGLPLHANFDVVEIQVTWGKCHGGRSPAGGGEISGIVSAKRAAGMSRAAVTAGVTSGWGPAGAVWGAVAGRPGQRQRTPVPLP